MLRDYPQRVAVERLADRDLAQLTALPTARSRGSTTSGRGRPSRTAARTTGFKSFAVTKVDARRFVTQLASHDVFDALSDRLQAALGDVRSRGKLTEDDVNKAMRQVRLALLEADVNFKVVKEFTAGGEGARARRGRARRR